MAGGRPYVHLTDRFRRDRMAGGDRRRSCAGHLPRRREFWLRDRCFLSARSAKSLADLNPRAARDHQPQWLAQAPSADSAAAASPIISAAVFPFRSSSFRHAALLLMTPWRYKTTIVAGTVITVNPALVAYFLALASLTKSGTFRCRARGIAARSPWPRRCNGSGPGSGGSIILSRRWRNKVA